jgi:hypothetical protein
MDGTTILTSFSTDIALAPPFKAQICVISKKTEDEIFTNEHPPHFNTPPRRRPQANFEPSDAQEDTLKKEGVSSNSQEMVE